MKKLNAKKGFSLIELLVVIAIIGVLSAVGITAYTGYTASAKEQAARTQFSQLVSLMNAEFAKCGLGSGDYAWGDSCDTALSTTMAATIREYVGDDLGFKNPYNQDQAATTFLSATEPSTAATATGDNGKISVVCDAAKCTIKQRVGTKDDNSAGEILSQEVRKAS